MKRSDLRTRPGKRPPDDAESNAAPGFASADVPELEIRGYEAIRPDVLQTFVFEHPGTATTVEISTDEFTAVCPWSGLPDFGRILVRYLPRERVLELRSFKYYLLTYRSVGIYQEHAANRILLDLAAACAPQWMELELDYHVRGGLHTVVRVRSSNGGG